MTVEPVELLRNRRLVDMSNAAREEAADLLARGCEDDAAKVLKSEGVKLAKPNLVLSGLFIDPVDACPPDIGHLAGKNLADRFIELLWTKVLGKHGHEEVLRALSKLDLPPSFPNIANVATHRKSWSISASLAFISIFPFLLARLEARHLHLYLFPALKATFASKAAVVKAVKALASDAADVFKHFLFAPSLSREEHVLLDGRVRALLQAFQNVSAVTHSRCGSRADAYLGSAAPASDQEARFPAQLPQLHPPPALRPSLREPPPDQHPA